MFSIDQYSYSNKLRSCHPGEKFGFALLTMAICLFSASVAACLAVALLMAGAAVLRAGIPWRFYCKLMALPLSFMLLGVAAIALSFTRDPGGAVFGINLAGVTIGTTAQALETAALVLAKSLGSVSCLYFLSLTTPMVEIVAVLRKLKVPLIFIELMSLTYRFIFVMADTAEKIYTAQTSRWGYSSFRRSCSSLGHLAASLFVKSYHRSRECFTSLMARCYDGELKVIEPVYQVSRTNIITIAAIDLALAVLAFYTGGDLLARIHP